MNPNTGRPLIQENNFLVDTQTGEKIFPIINGIPQFVKEHGNYAKNFEWQ